MASPGSAKIVWDDHPSLFQYTSAYIIIIVAVILLSWIQHLIYPAPFYVLTHYSFIRATENPELYWRVLTIDVIYFVMLVLIWQFIYYLLISWRSRYKIYNDQLVRRRVSYFGVIEQRTELYRIVDFRITQSMIGVLFRFSTIRLLTTDAANPMIELTAVRRGNVLLDLLRQETERCRVEKGVREFTGGSPMAGDFDEKAMKKWRNS